MPNENLSPTDALKERTLRAIRDTPSPVRRQRRLTDAAVMTASVMIMGAVFLAVGGVRPTGRPIALLIETAAGAGLIAIAALWLVLGRSYRMLGPASGVLLAVALLSPMAFLIWKMAWSSQYAGMMEPWPTRPGYRCLLLVVALAACPLLFMVFLRRHTDPTHPSVQGAALGAVFGMCATVLADLWCPVAQVPHLLGGHFLPVILLAAVGAWPLSRVLAMPMSDQLDHHGQSPVSPRRRS